MQELRHGTPPPTTQTTTPSSQQTLPRSYPEYQYNLHIHQLLKYYHRLPIFKSTAKARIMSLNQRKILFLPIPLVIPQLLLATYLLACHQRLSHQRLLALMKFLKVQQLTISHTLKERVKKLNATLSMNLHNWLLSPLLTSRLWPL